jgi:Uma2 family endonuclease
MSTTLPFSAQDLLAMPADGKRYELVARELHMMSPSGWKYGEIVGNLHGMLWNRIHANQLGKIFGAETGFLLSRNPDTVRAPDIAFIAKQHLPSTEPSDSYWPGAPDLAVEVLSPSDRKGEVDEKIRAWLAAGVLMVWVVDPKAKNVAVHRSQSDSLTHTLPDELAGDDVLCGFRCSVARIFGSGIFGNDGA